MVAFRTRAKTKLAWAREQEADDSSSKEFRFQAYYLVKSESGGPHKERDSFLTLPTATSRNIRKTAQVNLR